MDIWQNYWDAAIPTSIAGGFKDGYEGEIQAFWREHLTGDAEHILDLACGNGALTFLANDIVNHPSPGATRITGVDFAGIRPFEILKKAPEDYPKITFVPNTSIEALPLKDGSVDAVISQWGLEYSDVTKTIPEVGRVLKDSGQLTLVCHHEDTDILKRSRLLASKYPIILNRPEIFDQLMSLNELYNSKTNIKQVRADSSYLDLMAAIDGNMEHFERELQKFDDPTTADVRGYLSGLTNLFANVAFVRVPGRRAVLEANRTMLELSMVRFEDLFDAALSDEEFSKLLSLIEDEGLRVVSNQNLVQAGMGCIGRTIVATR